jgi:hypothetical protein
MPGGPHVNERGVAALLILFAMSAFSVLAVGALTTALGSASAGQTFSIFRSVSEDVLTKYVADMVVPNDWRIEGESGSYRFQLPVLVPENGEEDMGAPAAWHPIAEVPTLAVCCEARPGVCNERGAATGETVQDWAPGTDDALWLAFELSSQADPNATDGGSIVTARVSPATAVDGASVTCQLEFDGSVIAKGSAQLQRQAGSAQVGGTMRFAVKTR